MIIRTVDEPIKKALYLEKLFALKRSDGTINSAIVEYSVGISAELMPGFEVELGMEFYAFMHSPRLRMILFG